jgi:hypothetical protein
MSKLLLVGAKKNYNVEFFYFKAFSSLGYEVLQLNPYEGVRHPLLSRFVHTRTSYLKPGFFPWVIPNKQSYR